MKLKKIYDIELWASEVIYKFLLLLPEWKLRFTVLNLATIRLRNQHKWETGNERKKKN